MIGLPRKVGIYKQMYMMLFCEIFRAALYKALRNILKLACLLHDVKTVSNNCGVRRYIRLYAAW